MRQPCHEGGSTGVGFSTLAAQPNRVRARSTTTGLRWLAKGWQENGNRYPCSTLACAVGNPSDSARRSDAGLPTLASSGARPCSAWFCLAARLARRRRRVGSSAARGVPETRRKRGQEHTRPLGVRHGRAVACGVPRCAALAWCLEARAALERCSPKQSLGGGVLMAQPRNTGVTAHLTACLLATP